MSGTATYFLYKYIIAYHINELPHPYLINIRWTFPSAWIWYPYRVAKAASQAPLSECCGKHRIERAEKEFCTNPDCILADDLARNIQEWTEYRRNKRKAARMGSIITFSTKMKKTEPGSAWKTWSGSFVCVISGREDLFLPLASGSYFLLSKNLAHIRHRIQPDG